MCLDYTLYSHRTEGGCNFLPETTRESQTWEVCKEGSQTLSLELNSPSPRSQPGIGGPSCLSLFFPLLIFAFG